MVQYQLSSSCRPTPLREMGNVEYHATRLRTNLIPPRRKGPFVGGLSAATRTAGGEVPQGRVSAARIANCVDVPEDPTMCIDPREVSLEEQACGSDREDRPVIAVS